MALFSGFMLMSCYRSLSTMLGVMRFLEKCLRFLLVIIKLEIMLIFLLTILIHGSQH